MTAPDHTIGWHRRQAGTSDDQVAARLAEIVTAEAEAWTRRLDVIEAAYAELEYLVKGGRLDVAAARFRALADRLDPGSHLSRDREVAA